MWDTFGRNAERNSVHAIWQQASNEITIKRHYDCQLSGDNRRVRRILVLNGIIIYRSAYTDRNL